MNEQVNNEQVEKLVHSIMTDAPHASEAEVRERAAFYVGNNCMEHAPVLNRVPVGRMAAVVEALKPPPPPPPPKRVDQMTSEEYLAYKKRTGLV